MILLGNGGGRMQEPVGRDDADGSLTHDPVRTIIARVLDYLTSLFWLSSDDDREGRQW